MQRLVHDDLQAGPAILVSDRRDARDMPDVLGRFGAVVRHGHETHNLAKGAKRTAQDVAQPIEALAQLLFLAVEPPLEKSCDQDDSPPSVARLAMLSATCRYSYGFTPNLQSATLTPPRPCRMDVEAAEPRRPQYRLR